MLPNLNECEKKFGFATYGGSTFICLGVPEQHEKENEWWCLGIQVNEHNYPVVGEIAILIWNNPTKGNIHGECDNVLCFENVYGKEE